MSASGDRGRITPPANTGLRPAIWPEIDPWNANPRGAGSSDLLDFVGGPDPSGPGRHRQTSSVRDGDGASEVVQPELHWTLRDDAGFEPAKYHHLLRLPHRLSPTNYATWMRTMEAALTMVGLFEYCLWQVPRPRHNAQAMERWKRTNALVRSILAANMTEEVNNQAAHFETAAEMWEEAARLFAGRTLTDWTLTITSLVTARYVDGEDILAHVALMKKLRRDLVLMHRPLNDELFACFLRISMPPSWNYVFSALPARYTSIEVERRILDEHGIRQSQQTTAAAYSAFAAQSSKKKKHQHKPGDPFCTNCNRPGHWQADCWAKGGGAEGQGPRQQKKKKKEKGDDQAKSQEKDRDKKKKGKEKANQAIAKSDSDSEHSSYMAGTHSSARSRYAWILDGGSTTHICNDRTACWVSCAYAPGASVRGY